MPVFRQVKNNIAHPRRPVKLFYINFKTKVRPLMAENLCKMEKNPMLFPSPRRGGGNSTMLFRFIRVRDVNLVTRELTKHVTICYAPHRPETAYSGIRTPCGNTGPCRCESALCIIRLGGYAPSYFGGEDYNLFCPSPQERGDADVCYIFRAVSVLHGTHRRHHVGVFHHEKEVIAAPSASSAITSMNI